MTLNVSKILINRGYWNDVWKRRNIYLRFPTRVGRKNVKKQSWKLIAASKKNVIDPGILEFL